MVSRLVCACQYVCAHHSPHRFIMARYFSVLTNAILWSQHKMFLFILNDETMVLLSVGLPRRCFLFQAAPRVLFFLAACCCCNALIVLPLTPLPKVLLRTRCDDKQTEGGLCVIIITQYEGCVDHRRVSILRVICYMCVSTIRVNYT